MLLTRALLTPLALILCALTACPRPSDTPGDTIPTADRGDIRQLGRDNAPMAFVAEGPFTRGISEAQARQAFELCESFTPEVCEEDWFDAEQPQRAIKLDAFWIDVFEVTNTQHDRCVREGACPPIDKANCQVWDIEEGDWRQLTPPEVRTHYGDPDKPVVCVDWNDADTYCRWAGKHLPSEAQWEKAARGNDARTFPWGEQTPTCAMAHMSSVEAGGEGCGTGATSPIGAHAPAASPYGAQDMSGNALEWTLDFQSDDFYAKSPEKNPVNDTPAERRIIRGGAWNNEPAFLRTTTRGSFPPEFRTVYTGFRCAL